MSTQTPVTPVTPYRSSVEPAARDGFAQLLRAEWTKFRTVRRWGLALLAAVLVTVFISYFTASSSSFDRDPADGDKLPATDAQGLQVRDAFYFVHQGLAGDGSITTRVSGLTGERPKQAPEWAKAGIILKESTEQGAPYVALMVTEKHGVRLQTGFTGDEAGSATPPGEPRWLRLTRDGATVIGYESADGKQWDKVAAARLDGAPKTVRAGLFVASPGIFELKREFGMSAMGERPSRSTAKFDQVSLSGPGTGAGGSAGSWQSTDVGEIRDGKGTLERSGSTFTLTGSGDIAPGAQDMDPVNSGLSGSQLGLVLVAALGVLFITTEYRRGMIRTTLMASPRRPRVLAAKAVVIGAVVFLAGLVASVASFLISQPILRDNGHKHPYFHEFSLTDGPALRAVIGTAAVLALIAVLGLGLGALMRHTAAAIATVVVLFVLPLILVSGLPLGLAQLLEQVTPVAGFAIQQTIPRYDQVASACLPETGCYPQGPWTGLATLFAYAVGVLGLAMWRLRRRDA
ncbi:ABC transporter permease subunit [Streptomyces sp. NBC_01304]|uniref:ABC transporter permease subunit n=1 Tax=Streptomyces sp. NBC_01304 TaxID=2903818 RepID=UPI002E106F73|nr:ABC transporter permease subunit [Streptomyces sp. NBC_01304]